MLVLTRKIGEKIVIDDRITISLVEIKRNGLRIGINAPPEVRIHSMKHDQGRSERLATQPLALHAETPRQAGDGT